MYEAKCLVMDYQHAGSLVQPVSVGAQAPSPQVPHQFHQLHPLAPDSVGSSARWSQYQQLWRQHQMFMNGKSCGKESPDKKDDAELWSNVEAQTAFLGPNLWEKTLPYDTDLKYVDLDEFLSENGIPVEGGMGAGTVSGGVGASSSNLAGGLVLKDNGAGRLSPNSVGVVSASPALVPVLTKREPSPSPSEAAAMSPLAISPPSPAESTLSFASSSRDAFDPRTRAFSDEELKPQPMVKKSRKQDSQFVPDGLKDEKYWARRRKNNMAAKRSRDARRMKENQIALRAGFLEKENLGLRQEMDRIKKENMALREQLSKFTSEAI